MLPCPSTTVQGALREPEKEQQQQDTTANLFLSTDFPALKAGVSKEQKSTFRGASSRVGGAPVFREAYHCQQREVHGTNMRAVEAVAEDEDDLTGRRRRRVLDPDMVNSLMEDVRRQIATDGELVTKEKVRRKLNIRGEFWCF